MTVIVLLPAEPESAVDPVQIDMIATVQIKGGSISAKTFGMVGNRLSIRFGTRRPKGCPPSAPIFGGDRDTGIPRKKIGSPGDRK